MRDADPVAAQLNWRQGEGSLRELLNDLMHSHVLHPFGRASGNHATNDPISRITRGISDIIVRSCVDDDGASICVKYRDVSSAWGHVLHGALISSHPVFVSTNISGRSPARTRLGFFKPCFLFCGLK